MVAAAERVHGRVPSRLDPGKQARRRDVADLDEKYARRAIIVLEPFEITVTRDDRAIVSDRETSYFGIWLSKKPSVADMDGVETMLNNPKRETGGRFSSTRNFIRRRLSGRPPVSPHN